MKTLRKNLTLFCLIVLATCLVGVFATTARAIVRANASVPEITSLTLNKAEARIDTDEGVSTKNGIRFITTVSEEEYDSIAFDYDLEVITYIIPKSVLGEGTLNAENEDALAITVGSAVHVGEEYQFRAVLSDTADSNWNYADEILAKSILTVKEQGGDTVVTTKETGVFGRSIAYIAHAAKNDASAEWSSDETAILEDFIGTTAFYKINLPEGVSCDYAYGLEGQAITATVSNVPGLKVTSVDVTGVTDEAVDLESGSVSFTMPAAEVGFSFDGTFYDDDLETNVLLDFKEDFYSNGKAITGPAYNGASTVNRYELYNANSSWKPDHYTALGADGMVFWQTVGIYNSVRFNFGKSITLADVGGIYVKYAATYAVGEDLFAKFYDGATVKYEKRLTQYSTPAGDAYTTLNVLVVPSVRIINEGLTSVDHIELMIATSTAANFYIDEIGVVPKTAVANNKIVYEFGSVAEGTGFVGRNSVLNAKVGYVAATADNGLTGGAIDMSALSTQTGGSFTIINLDRKISVSEIESIEFKVYVKQPENAGDWLGFMIPGFNDVWNSVELGKNYDWSSEAVDTWMEYTVTGDNISAYATDNRLTEIYSVSFAKYSQAASATVDAKYYIDSMTINLKANA